MIDIDKVNAAWISQPLCQNNYVRRSAGGKPSQLCAVSALLSYVGVSVDLIERVYARWSSPTSEAFERAILKSEYGIPARIVENMPDVFDEGRDERAGIAELLRRFERHNARLTKKAEAARASCEALLSYAAF